MRVFPRFTTPRFKLGRVKMRHRLSTVTVFQVVLGIETLAFAVALLLILTGKRVALLERLGEHADVYAALILIIGFGLFHSFATRRLVPLLEGYLFPKPYEDRRIFLSLAQEARTASNIEQLYAAIARHIAESFEADDVSLLVLDQISGDYVCAASSSQKSLLNGQTQKNGKNNGPRFARDAFVVRRLNHLATPLVIGAREVETWERALKDASPHLRAARALEQESLNRLKSHLLVQITSKDQMVGILSLGLRRGQFSYGATDRETLMSVASQLALVIENTRLASRMLAQERLNQELILAAEVQRRFLPTEAPEHTSLQLAGFWEPARGVGGDYYDFITVDKERVGIAIADVVGKGIPAALLMSTVQATLRSLATNGSMLPAEPSLSAMVSRLNRLIFDSTKGQNHVTLFYAHFDDTSRRLTYVNAGHNPPLLLQPDTSTEVQQLTAGGLVAGVFQNCEYDQETVQLGSNDLLFLYTDGLTEATNRAGEEYGEARLKETLSTLASFSVNEIRDQIVRRVKEWCLGTPLYDDLTFVVMKVS